MLKGRTKTSDSGIPYGILTIQFLYPGIRRKNSRAKWTHKHRATHPLGHCSHHFGRVRQLCPWQWCTQPVRELNRGPSTVQPWPRFIFWLLHPCKPLLWWPPRHTAEHRDSGRGGTCTGRAEACTGRNTASTGRGGVKPVSEDDWCRETGRYEQQDFSQVIITLILGEKNPNHFMCISLYTWQKWSPSLPVCFILSRMHYLCLKYLVDQLVMELFIIWAGRFSGEAVLGMSQRAWCDRETFSCMTPCRIKLVSEGVGPFLQCGVFFCL